MNRMNDVVISSIKSKKASLGLSLRSLAERSGVTYPHLCRCLNGKSDMSLQIAGRVMEALKIKIKVEDKK